MLFGTRLNGEGLEMFFDMDVARNDCVIEKRSYAKEDLKSFDIVLGFDLVADRKSKSCVV